MWAQKLTHTKQENTIFKICGRVSAAQKKIFKEILHSNDPDGSEANIMCKNTDADNSWKQYEK